jgi:signal transduction histidine kinase
MISFEHFLDGVRVDVEMPPSHESPTVHRTASGVITVRFVCGAMIRVGHDTVTVIPPPRPVLRPEGAERATALCDVSRALVTSCIRIRATAQGALNLFDHLGEALVLAVDADDPLRRCFDELVEELGGLQPGQCAMVEALLRRALVLLLRRCRVDGRGAPPWLAALEDAGLGLAMGAMRDHPERAYTISELAEIAGMSRSVFAARFAEVTGHPPMEFLKTLRLARAAALLTRTDLPVKTIASQTGYSSRSSFTRAFFAVHGAAPKAFRATGSAPSQLHLVPSGRAAKVDKERRPGELCQRLADVALSLCRAESVAVTLLDGDVFHWEGVAGVEAGQRHRTMTRADSPAGLCIDDGRSHVVSFPDDRFPVFGDVAQALLVPFWVGGEAIGVVWLITHGAERKLDADDERIVRALAELAAAGWASSEGKDEFLAMLGHELRNPLAAIAGAAALLERGVTSQALDVLGRQVGYLAQIVDDLHDLSGISHGALPLRVQRVDLATVVVDAVTILLPRIEGRHQRLLINVPATPSELHADPVRLAQIVISLLDNATKYTPDGGEIRLTAAIVDDTMQLSVRDNGIGIPIEKVGGIFDPFAQLRRGGGEGDALGLGLALVERLVAMHGGTIEVASDGPGKGSEFTVRLPARNAPDGSLVDDLTLHSA